MGALGTALASAGGVALIALASRDIFNVLFHPEGGIGLAGRLADLIWRAARRLRSRADGLFALAGPLALVAAIAAWAAMIALGWALIFLPHMPEGFRFEEGAGGKDMVDALSLSLATLTTLGFGDVTPTDGWLRLITPLEALLGFGLLTASVSWLLLMYPVLSRRRSLAYEIHLLKKAERDTGVAPPDLEPASAEAVYAELTSRLVAVERDLAAFPISYYFAEPDDRFAFAALVPYLLDLAERGSKESAPDGVRWRARLLLDALDDFAASVARRFRGDHDGSTRAIVESYARDHLRAAPSAPVS